MAQAPVPKVAHITRDSSSNPIINPGYPGVVDAKREPDEVTDGGFKSSSFEEEGVTGDRVTGDRVTEGRVTEGRVTEGRVTEGRVTEGRVTEGRVTEGRVTEGRVTEGRVTEGRVTEGRVTEGQLTVEDIQEWVDGHLSETPLPFEIQQVGKHCWPAWSKHWDLDLAGAIVVWTKTEASRRKLGPSGHRLDSGQASFAPKLRAPDPPQAAFDLFTSTSRPTTSASQVTYARKSGLTPRILIYRVENGSDEHS